MESYNDKVDESTRARACIFDISQSTSPSDLFLVIKLEKVLQGDINDAAEPYLKDMVSVCEAQYNTAHTLLYHGSSSKNSHDIMLQLFLNYLQTDLNPIDQTKSPSMVTK